MNGESVERLLVTVVVPARNEEERIGDCLRALENQSLPRQQYEIVVVDNGSTDGTRAAVARSTARLLEEPKPSAYHARNLAIRSTDSEWLAFTDADCIPHRDWLENLLASASINDAWIVGGLTRYDIVNDNLGNRLLCETHQPDQLRETIESYHCVAGGNMFVRRAAFEQLGLFRVVRSGSDIEFSKRLAAAGFPSVFAENAVVRHQCDLSNWEYLRRSYRIRYGQRTHSKKSSGILAALAHLKQLPWRPGLRAATQVATKHETKDGGRFWAEWLYRWANRWAGFLGEWQASIQNPIASSDVKSDVGSPRITD
ncbi:4,4'-diaponeurosporenoate glycosyltransferase [Stieleria neptunia]|uniref:4,4'-diaponeurosporenoate glycosyltransferase n=1 Tax=Stieleria neptunia TaxID=2527979 RepID=A0A518HQS3_9BACT|nr:glycosyltransferase [Stieleria neptunia]QDV43148.1 4,4'-diaponeurosporenoate glycosyltransferase [Stieleria neptunia]